jgi:hypothetical protein
MIGFLDLDPVLTALDEFMRVVEDARERTKIKRGHKTGREFVRRVIQIVEVYIGARVGTAGKRGTPADGVRQIIEIIDPAIGKSTIEEALKDRSKETSALQQRHPSNRRSEIKRRKR